MKNRQRLLDTSPYDLLLKMNKNIVNHFKINKYPCETLCIMDILNDEGYECGISCEQCIMD